MSVISENQIVYYGSRLYVANAECTMLCLWIYMHDVHLCEQTGSEGNHVGNEAVQIDSIMFRYSVQTLVVV